MNRRTSGNAPGASVRPTLSQTEANPHPLPDLFSSVTQAGPTPTTTSSSSGARAGRVVSVPLAADRPPRPAPSSHLAGDYARTGQTLRRDDGRVLTVCQSTRQTTGRRADRYVRTAAVGTDATFCGSLYMERATGRCDLDGGEFQDRDTGTRYRLSLTSPDHYTVGVARRRRGRSGR